MAKALGISLWLHARITMRDDWQINFVRQIKKLYMKEVIDFEI